MYYVYDNPTYEVANKLICIFCIFKCGCVKEAEQVQGKTSIEAPYNLRENDSIFSECNG